MICEECNVKMSFMYASGSKFAYGDCPKCYKVTKITKEQFNRLVMENSK